ncbi:Uncharacterized protein FKW44_009478 [Caligus rogercresseyi]|uniref:Uncharacterized protein n=1 Tax=Caligus rogercresseyi TaxID=217165 RepID=A0A7T8K7D3_CALRO|nr:Uncharacterized protein FKW44_009478 [Caligus rogercresseyi]
MELPPTHQSWPRTFAQEILPIEIWTLLCGAFWRGRPTALLIPMWTLSRSPSLLPGPTCLPTSSRRAELLFATVLMQSLKLKEGTKNKKDCQDLFF